MFNKKEENQTKNEPGTSLGVDPGTLGSQVYGLTCSRFSADLPAHL